MSLKSVLRQFPMVQPDLMDQAPPRCQSGLPSPEWSDSEQSTRSTQSTQAPSPDSSQTLLNTKPGCFSFGTQMASILATTPEVQYPMISQHASAMQASSMLPRSKIARAQDQAEQKRLNQQITEAAKAPKAEVVDKVLALAEMHVERMNAINISTAMHRLVRAGESSNLAKIRRHPVMRRMTEIAENLARQELQHGDGRMNATCCTIIAWSCASLRIFRSSLFASLIQVASRGLAACQCFEITNLMWSIAEICRRHPEMLEELGPSIEELVVATASVFLARKVETFRYQVLISALMSLVLYPSMAAAVHRLLIIQIVFALAAREQELESENVTPMVNALEVLSRRHPHIFQDLLQGCRSVYPTFTARYMLRQRKVRSKPSKKTEQ